jgi:hypothetical protein
VDIQIGIDPDDTVHDRFLTRIVRVNTWPLAVASSAGMHHGVQEVKQSGPSSPWYAERRCRWKCSQEVVLVSRRVGSQSRHHRRPTRGIAPCGTDHRSQSLVQSSVLRYHGATESSLGLHCIQAEYAMAGLKSKTYLFHSKYYSH